MVTLMDIIKLAREALSEAKPGERVQTIHKMLDALEIVWKASEPERRERSARIADLKAELGRVVADPFLDGPRIQGWIDELDATLRELE